MKAKELWDALERIDREIIDLQEERENIFRYWKKQEAIETRERLTKEVTNL